MQSAQKNNKYHQSNTTNEIDLHALAHTLWASKYLIGLITLFATCIAAAYAFLSTPLYEVQVQALPPTQSGLAAYNMANQLSGSATASLTRRKESTLGRQQEEDSDNAIASLSPDDAYKAFLRHVDSNSLRLAFFNTIYLAQHEETVSAVRRQQLWEKFNRELSIKRPQKPADAQLMILTLQGTDPQAIAERANQYVGMAIHAAQSELLQNLLSAVQLRLNSTQAQIDTLREVAVITSQGEIAQLKEALQLAESIGLQEPPDRGNLITSYTGSTSYLRGAEALRSELGLMEQRRNYDPYISELPSLLRVQALLSGIDVQPKLSVATIDQSATAPIAPVEPRKPLILVLGVVMGVILGVLAALAHNLFRKD